MKLLIVDDNPVNLRLLRAQLEAEGIGVAEAANGVEALEVLRAGVVDGVVSDILMPEMDGYRLCLEVRRDASLRALPFVLYTSTYNSPADRQLALEVGADAYIAKPAPTREILEALRAAPRAPARTQPPAAGDLSVLRQYNEALVRKLEDKNRELERFLDRLGLMHQIDQAIIRAEAPAQIAESAVKRLRELLGVARASVSLFDLERGEAEWLAVSGCQAGDIGQGRRYALGRLGDIDKLRQGEIQVVEVGPDASPAVRAALQEAGVRWFVVVPMLARGELIGSLNFGAQARDFSAEQLQTAREVAAQIAIAVSQHRLDARAREADALYRLVFDNVPVGITMTGADGKILSANRVAARMFGYDTVEEAVAALQHDSHRVYADQADREDYVRRLRGDGTVREMEVELVRRDGSRFWASLDGKLILDAEGKPSLLVTIVDDITIRQAQEYRIARLSRVKEMQSSINAAVVRVRDWQALLDEVCRIAVEKGGLRAAWVAWHDSNARRIRPVASAGYFDGFLELTDHSTDLPPDAEPGVALGALRAGKSVVANDTRTAPGVRFRQEALDRGYLSAMHLPLVVDGTTEGVLILFAAEAGYFDDEESKLLDELAADVSFALDALRKAERLDYLAYYDPLTGLPNRSLFRDRLSHSLRSRGGDARLIAVALLDLDRLRRVNETHGRESGDQLIREIGQRLLRANDSTARLGADVFALVFRGARTPAEVDRALKAVRSTCFDLPFAVHGAELHVSCRAGVVVHPDDGDDVDALLRNAETALRRSKEADDRIAFYAPDMNARVSEALAIETKLRQAIDRRQFILHYQPKVSLTDGKLTGLEALIRWQRPDAGLVPPGKFIPVLEETGMIVEVGRWAVECAMADLQSWTQAGCVKTPRVAVNVSAVQLQRKDFVDNMIDAIERGGDNPDCLELEITEGLLMRNVEESTRKLSILRGMGVTVAIDDFGTGYSSLSYLGRLPVDALKIDRSFITGVATGAEAMSIVTTIIALAHGLKLKVVAEGVETREQAELLRLVRCDEAQGYYYSRPVPAADIEKLLRAGSALPAA